MLAALGKYVPGPVAAGWWLIGSEPLVRTAVDIAALATLVAGVFVVARYRATIDTQDKSGDALIRELEAAQSRNERLEKQLAEKNAEWVKFSEEQRELRHQLKNQLAAAEARTDLSELTRLILDNNKALSDQMAVIANALTPRQEEPV